MEVGAAANVDGDHHVVHDPDSDHGYYHDLVDLPPGFRFHPTDEEIITHYLTLKVKDAGFFASAIGEVDLNKCEPWDLPKKAKMGEKEWFFFCQRDKKYPTGMRTNRATDSGYWKATGKDKEIYKHGKGGGSLVGMKKTLVFYKGRAPKGEKTNWVMHEFRLEANFSYYNFPKSSMDEWVVCKVFHKSSTTIGIKRSPQRDDINDHVMSSRMNSFVDGLLDTPSSLMPSLVDAPPDYDHHDAPAASRFTNNISGHDGEDEDEKKGKFKGAITAWSSMNSNSDARNSHLSYYNSSIGLNNNVNDHHDDEDYKTFLMPPYNYNFNTNSFQANPAMMSCSQIKQSPNSSNKQLLYSQISSQKLAMMDRGYKLVHYLAVSPSSRTNQSTSCMISHSQDTGLSTADMNAEISSSMVSKQDINSSKSNYDDPGDDHVGGPLVDQYPPLSEFDSFWEY